MSINLVDDRKLTTEEAMMRDSDKLRMGMKIRTLRARRGMTQKELADAAGLGESALRSYELGARYPKEKHLESLAKALKVRPEAFEVYGIENELQFIHMLFNFEQTFKLEPDREGSPSLRSYGYGMVPKALMDWGKKFAQLEEGEISREEYEDWKDTYNPTILTSWLGEENPDPYTGKALAGEEREGAVHAVEMMPETLQDELMRAHRAGKI